MSGAPPQPRQADGEKASAGDEQHEAGQRRDQNHQVLMAENAMKPGRENRRNMAAHFQKTDRRGEQSGEHKAPAHDLGFGGAARNRIDRGALVSSGRGS